MLSIIVIAWLTAASGAVESVLEPADKPELNPGLLLSNPSLTPLSQEKEVGKIHELMRIARQNPALDHMPVGFMDNPSTRALMARTFGNLFGLGGGHSPSLTFPLSTQIAHHSLEPFKLPHSLPFELPFSTQKLPHSPHGFLKQVHERSSTDEMQRTADYLRLYNALLEQYNPYARHAEYYNPLLYQNAAMMQLISPDGLIKHKRESPSAVVPPPTPPAVI